MAKKKMKDLNNKELARLIAVRISMPGLNIPDKALTLIGKLLQKSYEEGTEDAKHEWGPMSNY